MELSTLTPYIETYKFPAVFIGSFFFGEAAILTAIFLAQQHHWPLLLVLFVAFLGTFCADITWFFLGKHTLRRLRFWQRLKEKYSPVIQRLRSQNPARQAYFLLFFKFLYGTRIITILYVALHKMSFLRFALFDSIGTLLWLGTLTLLGSAAWSGASYLLQTFHLSEYAFVAAFLLIVILKGIHLWIEKRNEK